MGLFKRLNNINIPLRLVQSTHQHPLLEMKAIKERFKENKALVWVIQTINLLKV
jgi:hypothetical protein